MNTFASFQAFDAFVDGRKVQLASTTNGSQVLMINGSVAATIKNDLKGSTIQETATKLRSVNLTLGIPHAGTTDNAGRPSLPCVMEAATEWDTIDL